MQLMSREERAAVAPQFKSYATVYNDFLRKEVFKLVSKDKCYEIFKEVDLPDKDEFEKLHKQMSSYITYKFNRTKKELVYNRLQLLTRTDLLEGPQYILAVLNKIKIQKEMFVLDLELGQEVPIPDVLS
jgi:hypothetical protein